MCLDVNLTCLYILQLVVNTKLCKWFLAAAVVSAAADIDDIAAALEDAIFNEFKSTETKYKNRVRSRIANFKVNCFIDH